MRVYHVGKEKPPFVFEYGSEEIIIYPGDKVWERVPYMIEVAASDGKIKKFKKMKWQMKEDQFAPKHTNYVDLTEDQMKFLNKGVFEEARAEYIKTAQELGAQLKNEADETIKQHEAKMKALEAKQKAEIAELEKKHIENRKGVVRV